MKLLTIKFNFERKKCDWKRHRNKRKKTLGHAKISKQFVIVERKKPPEKKIEEQEIEEIIIDLDKSNKTSTDIVHNKEEDEEVDLEYQKRLSSYSLL